MWVYLLWSHDEYGPEDLLATLEPQRVVTLAEAECAKWLRISDSPTRQASCAAAIERLAAHMAGGVGPGIYPLMDGWGGLHLQVAVLD